MEYSKTNRKRKAQKDYESLKQKTEMVSCMEVLTKEYFDSCIARLSSDISDIKDKLNQLEKGLAKTNKKSNLKTFYDKVESDSSVEILSMTPAKENKHNQRKKDTIDMPIENYGLLLDTGERMGRTRKVMNSDQYDPFALADESIANWLDSWLKIDRNVAVNLCTIKADKQFFVELIDPQTWLSEDHIDVGMSLLRKQLGKVSCPFHTKRLAFLDVPFTVLISRNYEKFLENPKKFDWSPGFIDYYNGVLPKCDMTNKRIGVDVDEVFLVLNIKHVHWIALDISILHRHIDVYDSIISIASDEEIEDFVKPYALMVPYLIKSFVSPAEQDDSNDAGYKIRRCGEIPQNKISGYCGVYALKYIECLALDVDMKIGLCDANIKDIRKKLATDMFMEANHLADL